MRKLLLASVALIGMTVVAEAQNHHRHRYNHTPRQHHRHHNVAPWVAGGLALGILGAMTYDAWGRPTRQCWDEMIGYDRYGREVYQRYCR
jgi:hypothetical protein